MLFIDFEPNSLIFLLFGTLFLKTSLLLYRKKKADLDLAHSIMKNTIVERGGSTEGIMVLAEEIATKFGVSRASLLSRHQRASLGSSTEPRHMKMSYDIEHTLVGIIKALSRW